MYGNSEYLHLPSTPLRKRCFTEMLRIKPNSRPPMQVTLTLVTTLHPLLRALSPLPLLVEYFGHMDVKHVRSHDRYCLASASIVAGPRVSLGGMSLYRPKTCFLTPALRPLSTFLTSCYSTIVYFSCYCSSAPPTPATSAEIATSQ